VVDGTPLIRPQEHRERREPADRPGGQQLGRVRHQRGDAIARRQTEVEQSGGQPPGSRVELAERPALVRRQQRWRIGTGGETGSEDGGEASGTGEWWTCETHQHLLQRFGEPDLSSATRSSSR
jgi:hypothetical protein